MTGGGAQVARNAVSLAGARVIAQAGNALLFFFMGRRLGFDQLGIYAAALSFYQIVSISGSAASTYLVREVARQPGETDRLLHVLTVLSLVGGGALAALGAGVIALVPAGDRLAAPIAVAALAVVPAMIASIQEGVFVAHGRASLQTLVSVAAAAFNVTAGFLLLIGGAGVTVLLTVFVVTQVVAAVIGHLLIRRVIVPERKPLGESLFRAGRRVMSEMRAYLGSRHPGRVLRAPGDPDPRARRLTCPGRVLRRGSQGRGSLAIRAQHPDADDLPHAQPGVRREP